MDCEITLKRNLVMQQPGFHGLGISSFFFDYCEQLVTNDPSQFVWVGLDASVKIAILI